MELVLLYDNSGYKVVEAGKVDVVVEKWEKEIARSPIANEIKRRTIKVEDTSPEGICKALEAAYDIGYENCLLSNTPVWMKQSPQNPQ